MLSKLHRLWIKGVARYADEPENKPHLACQAGEGCGVKRGFASLKDRVWGGTPCNFTLGYTTFGLRV